MKVAAKFQLERVCREFVLIKVVSISSALAPFIFDNTEVQITMPLCRSQSTNTVVSRYNQQHE